MMNYSCDLERVVDETREEMIAVACQRVGQRDAEDAVQEAIVEAFEAGGEVDRKRLLQSLQTVCNRLRGRRRRQREVGFEGLEELCAPQAHSRLVDEAVAQIAAANLTDLQRQVLTWRLEGIKTREIAQRLCVTPRMVQYHLRACGPRLRRMDVRDLGFASAQAMFDFCSAVVVYHAPPKTGTGVARKRLERM